jgi:bifunctional DNase/RNase
VDARPSDALALAVRVGAPIFAVPSVLDQAALGADGGLGEEGDETGAMLESTGEQIVDPRLDVFRDFVNSLDVDPDAEDRQS